MRAASQHAAAWGQIGDMAAAGSLSLHEAQAPQKTQKTYGRSGREFVGGASEADASAEAVPFT
jgi:hypothetical protein